MTVKTPLNGPQDGDNYPPPPGPPPGPNGLTMHPNEQPIPDSHYSELYDSPPPPHTTQEQAQQTVHQPPPPDSDGAPKKSSWGRRFSLLGSKAATPLNILANKLGAESFLPSSMDKEVEKASRILRAFCRDGIYTDNVAPETLESPVTGSDGKPTTTTLAKARKNRTLLTIPSAVIHRAVGLAIFTTARAGFHVSGATGSGVIVARLPDGSWSPPSGIQVHSIGAGLMIGIDIYDCVVVINTKEALQAFTQTRMSLGSDLAIVAGPWGAGGSVDFATPASSKGKNKADAPEAQPTDAPKDADTKSSSPPVDDTKEPAETSKYPSVDEPVNGATAGTGTPERPNAGKERKTSAIKQVMKQPTYSYVKSRGFYAGVQVDGTIVTERKDANAAFYGEPVSVTSILQAEVPLVPGKENWVNAINPLLDTIKGAEGWQVQQQGQGHWANQMGPDPNSTYGHGNAPQGFPTGYDPVFANHRENTSAKTPGPDPSMAGVTQGVTTIHLDEAPGAAGPSTGSPAAGPSAAQAKAAEAAAEANMNREREERERRELEQEEDDIYGDQGIQRVATQPPGYTEVAGSGEAPQSNTNGNADAQLPPAYEDDGAPKPGVGDTKGQPPS